MLIFDEIPGAFPWFDKIEKQNRYRANAEGKCDYKLISPRDALLPFQLRRPKSVARPEYWQVIEVNSGTIYQDVSVAIDGQLKAKVLEGYDYFYYNGGQLVNSVSTPILNMPFGFYYARITFTDNTFFYSEMFHIPENGFNVNDPAIPFLKLEWFDDKDVKPFYYSDIDGGGLPRFSNVAYLNSFIHASEPEIEEEGTPDGTGEIVPTFQKANIKYKVSELVPDFLKISLVLMQLHGRKFITTPGGIYSGEIKKLTTTSSMESGGFFSIVDLNFQQDLLIVNKNCEDNLLQDNGGVTGLTSVTITDGRIYFLGTAPEFTWVNIYSATSGAGPFTKIFSYLDRQELIDGVLSLPDPTEDYFKVESENFNGVQGVSAAIQKA